MRSEEEIKKKGKESAEIKKESEGAYSRDGSVPGTHLAVVVDDGDICVCAVVPLAFISFLVVLCAGTVPFL